MEVFAATPGQRHDPWSPELALVCPELRAAAIAALPDTDPDGLLPPRAPTRPEAPEFRLLRSLSDEPVVEEAEKRVPLPIAILAYTTGRAVVVAFEAAAVVGFVIGAFAAVAAINS